MTTGSVISMAKLAGSVSDMLELYRVFYTDASKAYHAKEMVPRVCRNILTNVVRDLRIPNPELKHPNTGEVSPLSDWVCKYMELTPEEWGGSFFADAGLIEVTR